MEKIRRQSDLQAFGLDPVVEDRQEIGQGLIGSIGCGRKPERRMRIRFLAGLLHEITHVLLQESDQVPGQCHPFLLFAHYASAWRAGTRLGSDQRHGPLTEPQRVPYDAGMSTSPAERYEIALNTPAGQLTTGLDVPAGFVPITSIVPLTRRLGEEMAVLEERRVRETGRTISCRMGCAACCRMLVPLSPPEAFALKTYVTQLPQERRERLIRQVAEVKRTLEDNRLLDRLEAVAESARPIPDDELEPINRAYHALRIPCPFLENEMCSIYEARPAACRELLVTSPADLCRDPVNNPVTAIPVSARIGTVLGLLWSGLTDSPPRLVPLPLALDWADQHEQESKRTWPGSSLIDEMLDKLWRVLGQEFNNRQGSGGAR